eukprot:Nitzschia sp. Nitz4//scaffold290_size23356//3169//5117//NITZ4_008486-RA/size23356-augustus-gene-0.33-mRNA-1//1//CDS//3329546087//8026//frame0
MSQAGPTWWREIRRSVSDAVNSAAHAANGVEEWSVGGAFEVGGGGGGPFPNFPSFPFPGQHAHHPPPPQPNVERTPPASARAIRQLPTIVVTPEDLVDETNRECCICLEPNNLGDKVCRLPCAHIFHSECILEWMHRKCSCPVCRYELPTDDPMFEAGRLERMKNRRPRFARYELERMSIKQLLALNRTSTQFVSGDKGNLVQFLIDHNCIELIRTPPPVEYALEDLKAMKVSQLKQAMTAAGVFYHATDVVEKSDMIEIFLNSGRITLVERTPCETNTAESNASPDSTTIVQNDVKEEKSGRSSETMVETVDEDSDGEMDQFKNAPLPEGVIPEVLFPSATSTSLPPATPVPSGQDVVFSEVVNEDPVVTADELPVVPDDTSDVPDVPDSPNANGPGGVIDDLEDERSGLPPVTNPSDTMEGNMSIPTSMEIDDGDDSSQPNVLTVPTGYVGDAEATQAEPSIMDSPPPEVASRGDSFHSFSVADLHRLAKDAGVDVSTCLERNDIVRSLLQAGVSEQPNGDIPIALFEGWSVSQLRAIASEVHFDLSHCSDRSSMLESILQKANNTDRPHLRKYLRVLSPLAKATLSELRATSRRWGVDISDCLEKDEIIQRLITKVNDFGCC